MPEAITFLAWATMVYRRIAQLGRFKSKVSLHPSCHISYKHHKLCPNYNYKPSTYSDFLTLHIHSFQLLYTYILLFRHVWASHFMAKFARPGNQEKRKLLQPEHMNDQKYFSSAELSAIAFDY